MYLRTTSRHNRDGSTVTYYQLAHNRRDPATGVVQADVVHSFGRADRLDRDELVRLCRSIARVCGLEVQDALARPQDGSPDRREGVLPDGVTQLRTLPLGTLLVIAALWERLGIGPALREEERRDHCRVRYERALLGMTANRLCDPTSKYGVWERWLPEVWLPECWDFQVEQMYEAMDLLHRHLAAVEEAVFFRTADLLNLVVDVVFYDTTNVTFAVDEADEGEDGLRRFGRPKEGGWAPQVVVALAVTREGLPVRSWVFPGNTADVATVERVKADLRGWKLGRALFVADSGMNSEENREGLARACGRYLLATRAGSVKEVQEKVLTRAGRRHVIAENLHAKEVEVGAGEKRRRYIVCFNPAEAERQAKHREVVLAQLEEELGRHPDRSASQKWAVELLASGRFGRYLRVDGRGRVAIHGAAVRKAERMDGKWVLQTNDDTLTLDDAASGYKSLLVIESCFRSLKTAQLRLDPVFHWVPRRIEAHVKICVLALLVQRVAELAVGQPWARIRGVLDRLQVTEYATETHRFFQRNEVTPAAAEILAKLDVAPPRLVLDVRPAPAAA
jgi:transposase